MSDAKLFISLASRVRSSVADQHSTHVCLICVNGNLLLGVCNLTVKVHSNGVPVGLNTEM